VLRRERRKPRLDLGWLCFIFAIFCYCLAWSDVQVKAKTSFRLGFILRHFWYFWLFCCLIWCSGKGENLVQTWLHFALFLLFYWLWCCLILLDFMLLYCLSCYRSLLLSYRLTCYGIVFLILVLTVVGTLTETPRQHVFIRDNEKANGWGGWGQANIWFALVILILVYRIVVVWCVIVWYGIVVYCVSYPCLDYRMLS